MVEETKSEPDEDITFLGEGLTLAIVNGMFDVVFDDAYQHFLI